MYDFDHQLFLALNFDGGPTVDHIMSAVSGSRLWIPLYLLILFLVWRRYGWRNTLLFLVLMIAALGAADLICGIFKAQGPLKHLLPNFSPRWRPMYTPELEGLNIAPDSLYALRLSYAEGDWAVHIPAESVGALRFGTVSSHAATVVALAVFSGCTIRRRWFTILMVVCTLVICYSRIYLAKHFPMDIVWGALVGGAAGYAAWRVFNYFAVRFSR